MVNMHLKRNILEVVNNQINMNNPKITKETFERLTKAGYSEKKAKEMIGAVLVEEFYYILKEKQQFNEARYTKNLNQLK